jgi:UPF0755 protein
VKFLRYHLRDCLFLLLAAILVLAFFTFFLPQPSSDPNSESTTVTISKGMSVRSIGLLLQEQGVIRNARIFVLAAKVWGKEGTLQAGRYSFSSRNSLVSLLSQLSQGRVHSVGVTIPEGLTVHEIAHRFKEQADVDSAAFIGLVHDENFIRSLGIDADHLEGYLFPNTYMVYWEMDPKATLTMMVEAFWTVFTEALKVRAGDLGMSVHQSVTLASLVEREVKVPEERAIISAVFHNRLKLGRALESCATVEYALGVHKPRLTEEDLKAPSPYNTYLHPGLPPGPICSPGKAAVEAALYPADVDYLYFVSEGNGRHIFSRSLEEHTRAKHRVRREARNRKNREP